MGGQEMMYGVSDPDSSSIACRTKVGGESLRCTWVVNQ